MNTSIEPFEIHVDDSVLDDLRDRLARTRIPDQIDGTGWEYGIPVDYLRELVDYWRDDVRLARAGSGAQRVRALPHDASTASRSTSSMPARRTPMRCRCSSRTVGPVRSWSSST